MLCAKKIKEMLQAKKEGEKTKQCCMPKKDKTNVASKNSKMLRAKAGKSHPILGAWGGMGELRSRPGGVENRRGATRPEKEKCNLREYENWKAHLNTADNSRNVRIVLAAPHIEHPLVGGHPLPLLLLQPLGDVANHQLLLEPARPEFQLWDWMSNKYSTLEREIAAEHSPFLRYHPVQPLFRWLS